jgi:putative protease
MVNTPPNHKIELLAPAGNCEKLEIALHYGADAIYLSGQDFSLRNVSANFSIEDLNTAIQSAHRQGVKVYVACNIYSRNYEQNAIKAFLARLADLKPDAVIIADPGVFLLARRCVPEIPIHLSTQANTTNFNAAQFWLNQGVKRINVARELSLREIAEISANCSLEIEAFVHGAMCISYSGRCLLSSFMANRESNRGLCAHPCRWKYAVMEESRPGQYMPILEDSRGTYIFNSRDLCMIEHLPKLIESGITSLKIEGRLKGIHYLATTVNVYRQAIDTYYADPSGYQLKGHWIRELKALNHRGYSTGFYFDDPKQIASNFRESESLSRHAFVAKVIDCRASQRATVEVRNKISAGDDVEIIKPGKPSTPDRIIDIFNADNQSASTAQPGSIVTLKLIHNHSPNDLIRKSEL